MTTPQPWAQLVVSAIASLLVVSLGALSAPVTANRFRLGQLDRLQAVLDRMDVDDPSRSYLEAEARKKAAWWTATTVVRLSRDDVLWIFLSFCIGGMALELLIFPNPLRDWPFEPWFVKLLFTLGAVLEVTVRLGARRWERVRVYNTLISAGSAQFSMISPKRPLVPRWVRGRINAQLEDEGVTTCPRGHPVAGSLLRIVPVDDGRIAKLICARCGATLPRPLAADVDAITASVTASLDRLRRKQTIIRDARRRTLTFHPAVVGVSRSKRLCDKRSEMDVCQLVNACLRRERLPPN